MTESPASSIHRLPPHIANQIAAGEVVQRPESVVKELVENAIDAGARTVDVHITQAGKTLIQVIDDGDGMTEADALLAFERHATSKIGSIDDLERVTTFGFRGEALPSIASVSTVELRTRTAGEEVATFLRIAGGALEERTKVQGPPGSAVSVRNLFSNTPARRQFLKSDATEYRHIADTMQHFLLAYPQVGFLFTSDGITVFSTPPCAPAERLRAVFGERLAASLIAVEEETDLLTITGWVGRPSFAKRTRGDQHLFVNGRFVISRLLNHAIVSAYDTLLQQSEYPVYALFLNLDPRAVDVNVHPSKLEVKFSNERNVYTMLNAVVRRHLFQSDLTPSLGFRDITTDPGAGAAATAAAPSDAMSGAPAGARTRMLPPEDAASGTEPRYDSFASLQRGMDPGMDPGTGDGAGFRGSGGQGSGSGQAAGQAAGQGRLRADDIDDLFRSIGVEARPRDEGTDEPGAGETTILLPSEKPISDTQFLWQLHNKYIFTPIKSGLMIIDQHVAHERVLYEKALDSLDHASPFSQQLLFPQSFRTSPADFALLGELHIELERIGFLISLQAPNFVTVEAVPQDVRYGMEESILQEMLEQYKEYSATGRSDSRHCIAASYGCRAAIKAGDKLSPPEMQILIDKLFATSNPYICPHGRPIVIKLSLEELDQRFGR